ncbi:MAG: dephospho-CoA kinase [Butyricicoccus pullicaecorum]
MAEQVIDRILYDAPTLFQTGFDRSCDAVIGVVASRETRIQRIMQRDGLSETAAAARIDAQPDEAFYREKCDFVLENNGSLEDLKLQVESLCDKLR